MKTRIYATPAVKGLNVFLRALMQHKQTVNTLKKQPSGVLENNVLIDRIYILVGRMVN